MTIRNITDRELELERWIRKFLSDDMGAYMSGFCDGIKSRWVGLTDEEAVECFSDDHIVFWKNVESKLKEKSSTSPPAVPTSGQKN